MSALDWVLLALAVPAALASGYLALLAALARRTAPPAPAPPGLKFDLVVPAHDEEAGIAATVADLLELDYPRGLFRVLVVADNCTDRTAERAREAGATVLIREEPAARGKGHALAFAFARALEDRFADAVVVIDADTRASRNLLRAFSARFAAGARAVQAEYAVLNPEASWRTRLMALAFALFHGVRSLGRERLGLSSGLRGNGMCFACDLLFEVPHRAFSVVEDLEYGIALGRAGVRVHFAAEARVWGEMAPGAVASATQRLRWEGGRRRIARGQLPGLLREALERRSALLLDLALDLAVPPLATVASFVTAGLGAAAALSLARGAPSPSLLPWAAAATCLGAYVARGWILSEAGGAELAALLRVPLYVVWKARVRHEDRAGRAGEWVRTAREAGGRNGGGESSARGGGAGRAARAGERGVAACGSAAVGADDEAEVEDVAAAPGRPAAQRS